MKLTKLKFNNIIVTKIYLIILIKETENYKFHFFVIIIYLKFVIKLLKIF
jgi:hypothetical protein